MALQRASPAGIRELPPLFGPGPSRIPGLERVEQKGVLDIPAGRNSTQAVYAAQDDFLASLKSEYLDRSESRRWGS